MKGYTLNQLRGAWAAGKRSAEPLPVAMTSENQKARQFAAGEFKRLIDEAKLPGVPGFNETRSQVGWVECIMVDALSRGRDAALDAAIEDAETHALATIGPDWAGAVSSYFDATLEEVKDRMARAASRRSPSSPAA